MTHNLPSKTPQYVFLTMLATFTLAGCTPSLPPNELTVNPNEVVEGYPCQQRCNEFRSGFDTARNQQYMKDNECELLGDNERIGCLSYVYEYHLEHDQPAGYSF